jgi:hypothetical protein
LDIPGRVDAVDRLGVVEVGGVQHQVLEAMLGRDAAEYAPLAWSLKHDQRRLPTKLSQRLDVAGRVGQVHPGHQVGVRAAQRHAGPRVERLGDPVDALRQVDDRTVGGGVDRGLNGGPVVAGAVCLGPVLLVLDVDDAQDGLAELGDGGVVLRADAVGGVLDAAAVQVQVGRRLAHLVQQWHLVHVPGVGRLAAGPGRPVAQRLNVGVVAADRRRGTAPAGAEVGGQLVQGDAAGAVQARVAVGQVALVDRLEELGRRGGLGQPGRGGQIDGAAVVGGGDEVGDRGQPGQRLGHLVGAAPGRERIRVVGGTHAQGDPPLGVQRRDLRACGRRSHRCCTARPRAAAGPCHCGGSPSRQGRFA